MNTYNFKIIHFIFKVVLASLHISKMWVNVYSWNTEQFWE